MMSLGVGTSQRGAPNPRNVQPHQKKRCFPEVMSKYPEYCLVVESQILGLVTLSL